MDSIRTIKKIFTSRGTLEGGGVNLKRGFGFSQVPLFDPFLLLDDFNSDNPEDYIKGFPWHPHRGIETITYVLEGEVEHGDSLGNQGLINAGDVQWMTAGSGIIHQEMPKGDKNGRLHGFQLWANLPKAQKMIDPGYQEILQDEIPTVKVDNKINIRVISGEVNGIKGPVKDIMIKAQYLDILIPPSTEFKFPVNPNHKVFTYVIEGQAYFDKIKDPFAYEVEGAKYTQIKRDCLVGPEQVILYGTGNSVNISTKEEAVRFLLISGKPLKEPVAWYGPIVMNTQQELKTAFEEFNNGTFIKKGKARG